MSAEESLMNGVLWDLLMEVAHRKRVRGIGMGNRDIQDKGIQTSHFILLRRLIRGRLYIHRMPKFNTTPSRSNTTETLSTNL